MSENHHHHHHHQPPPAAFIHVHTTGSTSASISTIATPISNMERQLSGEPGMNVVVREAAQSFGEYYSRDPSCISLTCAHPALEPFALFVCRVVNIPLDSLHGRIIELAAELYLFRNDPDALRLVMEFWYHYMNFTTSRVLPPASPVPRAQSVVEKEIFHQQGLPGEKMVQFAIEEVMIHKNNNSTSSETASPSLATTTNNNTEITTSPVTPSTATSPLQKTNHTNNNNNISSAPPSPAASTSSQENLNNNNNNNNNNATTSNLDVIASNRFEIFLATQMGVLQSCIEAYFSADWHRQSDVMVINKQHRDFMKKREWKKYIVEGYKQFREFCNRLEGGASSKNDDHADDDETLKNKNKTSEDDDQLDVRARSNSELVEQMLKDLWNERNTIVFNNNNNGMGTATNSVVTPIMGHYAGSNFPLTTSSAMFPLYAAPSANFYPPSSPQQQQINATTNQNQHSRSTSSSSNLMGVSSPSGFPVLVPLPEERSWLNFNVVNAAELKAILSNPNRTNAVLIVFHAAFSTPSTIFVSSTLTAVRQEIEAKNLPVEILVINASVEINLLLEYKVEEFPTVFLQPPPSPRISSVVDVVAEEKGNGNENKKIQPQPLLLQDMETPIPQRGETEVWSEGKQTSAGDKFTNNNSLTAPHHNNNTNIVQPSADLFCISPSQNQTFTAAPSMAETDSNGDNTHITTGVTPNSKLVATSSSNNNNHNALNSTRHLLTLAPSSLAPSFTNGDNDDDEDQQKTTFTTSNIHHDHQREQQQPIMFPSNGVMNRKVLLEWINSLGTCPVAERKLKKFVTKLVRLDQRLRFAPFRKLHSAANTVRRLCTATHCAPLGRAEETTTSRGTSNEALDTLADGASEQQQQQQQTQSENPTENPSSTAAKPLVPKEPRFIFLGGGAASGKSTAVMALKTSPWWEENKSSIVVVDADEFKRHDPMYHGNTGDLHEKSVSAAEFLLVLAVNEGRHIVFDSTMMWAPFVEQTISMIRDSFSNVYEKGPGWQGENLPEVYWQKKGPRSEEEMKTRSPYSIAVYGIFADPARSVPRALVRELTSGRTMLVAVLLKSLKLFAKNFERYCELVDEAVLFDNNVFVDLEKGELPPTAAKKDFKGGPLEILDEGSWRNFCKHKELNPRATKLDELYEGYNNSNSSNNGASAITAMTPTMKNLGEKSMGTSARTSGSATPQHQD